MLAEANDVVPRYHYEPARDVFVVHAENGGAVELYPHQFAGLFTPLPDDDSEGDAE